MAGLQVQKKAWRVGFRSENFAWVTLSGTAGDESWGRASTAVGPVVCVLILCLELVNSSSVKDLRTYTEGPEKSPQIDLPVSWNLTPFRDLYTLLCLLWFPELVVSGYNLCVISLSVHDFLGF